MRLRHKPGPAGAAQRGAGSLHNRHRRSTPPAPAGRRTRCGRAPRRGSWSPWLPSPALRAPALRLQSPSCLAAVEVFSSSGESHPLCALSCTLSVPHAAVLSRLQRLVLSTRVRLATTNRLCPWQCRQLGVVKYLQQHFDLARVQLRGASAGGLVACLCACSVDPERAVRYAPGLCTADSSMLFRGPGYMHGQALLGGEPARFCCCGGEVGPAIDYEDCAAAGWRMRWRWRARSLSGAWACWASGAAWSARGLTPCCPRTLQSCAGARSAT